MMLIRFPLELPSQELPPKRKPDSRTKVLGQTLLVVAIVLFLIYFLAPALEIGMIG